MKLVDIILILAIAAAIGLAVGHLVRHKGCGGTCGSCPYGGSCNKKID